MFKRVEIINKIMLVILLSVLLFSCSTDKKTTRAYYQEIADNYLEAMVAGDPSVLPLSDSVKFTENTYIKNIGEGLWEKDLEGPTSFKIYAIDLVSKQVGFYGVLKDNGKPLILALRLKIEGEKISEIEHVIARHIGEKGMKNLITPRAGLVEPVPVDQRVSRERMFEIADLYFESIEQNDGSVAPYADDCVRHENGGQTTTNEQPDPADFGDSSEEQLRLAIARVDACGCAKQMDTQNLAYITKIRPRRLTIIDEELGLVYGFPMFVHKGDVQSVDIIGVPGVDSLPKKFPPFNLQAGEIFKISGGQIHEIEANGTMVPYNAPSGWGDDE